ncbi:AAA family ATPase [Brevundimonas sp.]|uniref:McrB family protein n=2 Tax=Brevundimonas sp. TaxID=1871086 RepID=UPI002FC9CB70
MTSFEVDSLEGYALAELRREWGYEPDERIVVIGNIRAAKLPDGKTIYFLEDLKHASSFSSLRYPHVAINGSHSAFIGPVLPQGFDLQAKYLWALAELTLSPKKEREKHKNPYQCNVVRGTLRPLSEMPKDWHFTVRGPATVALLETAVHDAIMARANKSTASQIASIKAKLNVEQSNLEAASSALARALSHQATADARLADTENQYRDALRKLDLQRDKYEKEKALMEARLSSLAELAERKGERLHALGLLDADDLKRLRDPHPPAANGLSLAEAFDGDFSRLAPHVQAVLWSRNLMYTQDRIRNFLALTRTSDLVILAGDSGSGKTSMVKAVAQALGAICEIIAVKPNWTGPEDLIGYFNPVERKYQSTPFLDALLRAEADPNRLHFILLDEMNLARVEYYFADFLSYLETRDRLPEIPLFTQDEERHVLMENGIFLSIEQEARLKAKLDEGATIEDLLTDETANNFLTLFGGFKNTESILAHHARLRRGLSGVLSTRSTLSFPANVRIMGAVNMDDTTHSLSPKVLDRAHVLRFDNPFLTDWEAIENEIEPLELTDALQILPEEFGARTDYPAFDRTLPAAEFLARLARVLDPLGVEFGYRAIRQGLGYLQGAQEAGLTEREALNNIILMKVLPKLTLDLGRVMPDGRPRREQLLALRDLLAEEFADDLDYLDDSCVQRLEGLAATADANNGLASYWVR